MPLINGEDTKKRVENLVDQLGSFGADISSLRSNVGNMLLHLEGESYLSGHVRTSANFTAGKRLEVLEWLSKIKSRDHHAEVARTRLEGTGAWLLQRKEIRSWLEAEESSILWLHGKGNTQGPDC